MKVWIFSNYDYGYGEDICAACVKLCSEKGIPYQVIFSPKYRTPRRTSLWKVMNLLRRLASAIRNRRHALSIKTAFPVRIVPDVNDPKFGLSVSADDIGVVAGFNQIFRAPAIARFRELLNVHPSVLPLYRGPVPSRWCLANGELMSGFTIHRVTPTVDAGEIIYQEAVAIDQRTSPEALDRHLSSRAAAVIPSILKALILGQAAPSQILDAYTLYRVHQAYAGFTTHKH